MTIAAEFEPFDRRPSSKAEDAPKQALAVLSVPGMRCSACIAKIENALNALSSVDHARVNLSTKRVTIRYGEGAATAQDFIEVIEKLGFEARTFDDFETSETADQAELKHLLWCLAVAGFAAANVMLLSVSVWSGASDATRSLFQWLSALIALPALTYSGRPFFRSAWSALRKFRLNMDVPISLAVLLSAAVSLYETMTGGVETYFDASVMLLFFLLIGRVLDHMMRAKARSAVAELVKLAPKEAEMVLENGRREKILVSEIEPGMSLFVAPGSRIPVDGEILSGTSDLDLSLVTGESNPQTVSGGDDVLGGVMNLSGPLTVKATAASDETFLSEVVQLMEKAEQGKARYVHLASQAANIYAPVVHLLALATFIGWLSYTNGDWHQAIFIATSVLIITCPCALGLAVPVVQIVASGELFRKGIMVKDGAGLEKLGSIDTVLFDKTGTVTLGRPRLLSAETYRHRDLSIAAGLAQASNHPLSCAIVRAAQQLDVEPAKIDDVQEVPGCGLEGTWQDYTIRLGKASWCLPSSEAQSSAEALPNALELFLVIDHEDAVWFSFEDQVKADAHDTVEKLRKLGLGLELVSGDRPETVEIVAAQTGIGKAQGELLPQKKLQHLETLESSGNKVLMVGDGINDAPSLAAAYASMAPSSASDIGRTSADFVFFGEKLRPVFDAIVIAKNARLLVHQNFALAAIYNVIAVPIAVLGFASPLIAAIAMSLSSLLVTLNALRLRYSRGQFYSFW